MKKIQETEQERKKQDGKKGSVIVFNNNIIKNKDTDIIVRTFVDDVTSQNVYIFVLNYTLDETPYEVILGKLQLNNGGGNLSEKARIVKEHISKQLIANNQGRNNLDYCEILSNLCLKKDIPFIYSDEGAQIVTNNSEMNQFLERTYHCNEDTNILKLKCLKPEKRMDLDISRVNVRKRIIENRRQNKAYDAAKRELEEKALKKFIIGKQLKDLKSEESIDVIFAKKEPLIKYLKQKLKQGNREKVDTSNTITIQEDIKIVRYYREVNNRVGKIQPEMVIGKKNLNTLEEQYFKLKEKGIAIDIKKILEEQQNNELEESNQKLGMANNEEEMEEMMRQTKERETQLNSYKTLIDLMRDGRDLSAQFYYSITPNELTEIKKIVENQLKSQGIYEDIKGKEITKYLKEKESLLQNIKLNKGKSYLDLYNSNENVKEFVDFVMNTKSRNETKKTEKELLAQTYEELIDNWILRHEDDVKLYNTYAIRFGAKTCTIPEKTAEKEGEENPGSSDHNDGGR